MIDPREQHFVRLLQLSRRGSSPTKRPVRKPCSRPPPSTRSPRWTSEATCEAPKETVPRRTPSRVGGSRRLAKRAVASGRGSTTHCAARTLETELLLAEMRESAGTKLPMAGAVGGRLPCDAKRFRLFHGSPKPPSRSQQSTLQRSRPVVIEPARCRGSFSEAPSAGEGDE
jgi:hypothetical protein